MFPVKIGNHFDSAIEESPKTTNNCCEGFHNALNSVFHCSHPSVWYLFEGLQRDMACHKLTVVNTEAGDLKLKSGSMQINTKFWRNLYQLYKQCDGLGMGLPQSPIFADIFLSFHEEIWLSNCPIEFKPIFYRRYVDDTFILFSDKSHAPKFLNYINRQHDNINFTMETESTNSLSFLDVLVSRQNNEFVTSVFRKSSFSGLGISFLAFAQNNSKLMLF